MALEMANFCVIDSICRLHLLGCPQTFREMEQHTLDIPVGLNQLITVAGGGNLAYVSKSTGLVTDCLGLIQYALDKHKTHGIWSIIVHETSGQFQGEWDKVGGCYGWFGYLPAPSMSCRHYNKTIKP